VANITVLKKQAPLRFMPDDWKKIKAKMVVDKITYQKLGEILFKAYMRNNKEIMKLVLKYADDKENKKKRYGVTELEAEEILKYAEQHSPLSDFDEAIKELEDEE